MKSARSNASRITEIVWETLLGCGIIGFVWTPWIVFAAIGIVEKFQEQPSVGRAILLFFASFLCIMVGDFLVKFLAYEFQFRKKPKEPRSRPSDRVPLGQLIAQDLKRDKNRTNKYEIRNILIALTLYILFSCFDKILVEAGIHSTDSFLLTFVSALLLWNHLPRHYVVFAFLARLAIATATLLLTIPAAAVLYNTESLSGTGSVLLVAMTFLLAVSLNYRVNPRFWRNRFLGETQALRNERARRLLIPLKPFWTLKQYLGQLLPKPQIHTP